MPLPRDLTAATEASLHALVDAQESEGTYLEFKRELPRPDNAGRHEVVADVSAFANSSGGDLIYGIAEDGEGRAAAVVPLPGNPDEEARRLQDVLMNNIEPRVPGLQVQPVLVAGGFALAVRVPQSWGVLTESGQTSISSSARTAGSDSSTSPKYVACFFVRTARRVTSATSAPSALGKSWPARLRIV